jgi:hypothetical protein
LVDHVDDEACEHHRVDGASICVEKGSGSAVPQDNCRPFLGRNWTRGWDDIPLTAGNQLVVYKTEEPHHAAGRTMYRGDIKLNQTMNDPYWVSCNFQAHFRVTKR